MNLKVVIAFLLGLVVALSIAVLLKRDPVPSPPPTEIASNAPPAPTQAVPVVPGVPVVPPAPKPSPKPSPMAAPVPKPATKPAKLAPAPPPAASPKPSPDAAAPAPTPAPVEVAKNDPPAPAPTAVHEPAPSPVFKPDPPKVRVPKTLTIPAGTVLNVRLAERLTSSGHTNGDSFSATFEQPLIVDGFVIAERGARVDGAVVEAVGAGRVKGRASLGLELKKFRSSDGQDVAIQTDTFRKEAESTVKNDAAKVGIATGIGAAIGAIAGGGKGAAIGAGVGGGAGAGGVLATKGKDADLPAETRLSFRLSTDVPVTEKLK
ncbi:MAG: hypothetical protein ABI972_15540 [Acidobacteriota bacterium]